MKKRVSLAIALAAAVTLSGCGGGSSSAAGAGGAAATTPQRGGELTVLLDSSHPGSWPTGLDPATDTTGGANLDLMQAVYGGLFLLESDPDGSHARVQPNQAQSLTLSGDAKTMTVKLRPGITFSDGTPLDAQAVAFNWRRDLQAPCTCKPSWPLAGTPDDITTPDPLTVVVTFARPYGAAEANFPVSNVNWIVSPTALQKAGEDAFKVTPVGAGPFTVVSDQLSTRLTLQRNSRYFKQGLPYLDKLTFQSIGGDQPAYQAMLAGQAQAYIALNTIPLLAQAQKNSNLQATMEPTTAPYFVQLNTQAAPFDNPKARQAIYAATDWSAIAKGIFADKYPVSESFTAPGGEFYHAQVPGYQGYDLALAKKLVHQVGDINVQFIATSNPVSEQIMTALQTQWAKAGIHATIQTVALAQLVKALTSGNWTVDLTTAGAWDPAAGLGVGFRFSSTSRFSGVKNPQLDDLLDQAATQQDSGKRDRLYQQAAELIAKNYYGPFGLAFSPTNLAVAGVHGPGLTTKVPALAVFTSPIWDQVWRQGGHP